MQLLNRSVTPTQGKTIVSTIFILMEPLYHTMEIVEFHLGAQWCHVITSLYPVDSIHMVVNSGVYIKGVCYQI